MPVLAVVAFAAGATAVTVAVTAVTLMTAITYVGVGMSVIGAVTGNKSFSTVGAVMGLIGAAGAIGSSVSSAASATGEVGSVASSESALDATTFDSAMSAQGAAELQVTQADPYLAANQTAASAEGAASSAAGASGASVAAPETPNAGAPATPASDNILANTQTPSPDVITKPGAVVQETPQPATSTPATLAPSPTEQPVNAAVGTPTPPPSTGGISGWWSNLKPDTKAMYIKGLAQGAASLFQGWSEEQKLALAQEIERNKQADMALKQTNLNAQPTVSFKPVPGYSTPGILSAAKIGGLYGRHFEHQQAGRDATAQIGKSSIAAN